MRTTPEVMEFLKVVMPEVQIAPWQVELLRHIFAQEMRIELPDPRVQFKRMACERLNDFERYKIAMKVV